MTYRFLNTIFGWCSFLIALTVYMITLEPSVSLWDCGEFISSSDSLQVVHPPGAPFFAMIGRMFILLTPAGVSKAISVNMVSAVCSALTVMFVFWITSMLALSVLKLKSAETKTNQLKVFASAFTAAMIFCFSDTFWFSAVEAEVYAMSVFFMAIVLWAALKWFYDAGVLGDKWLILISLLVGLSIGVHLLSLLVIPSIAFLYLYKHHKVTRKSLVIAFVCGLGALFFVQNFIIPGMPAILCKMELLFVNGLGMPFDSGIYAALLILVFTLVGGLYYFSKIKLNRQYVLAISCFTYIIIGFSSYALIPIRSREVLPIDMNNPEEPFNLKYYINREQYEERPLLYGHYFNSQPSDVKEGAETYRKDKDIYFAYGRKREYVFESSEKTFFPRMSDQQKESSPQGYRYWSGLGEVENEIYSIQQQIKQAKTPKEAESMKETLAGLKAEKPKFGNNLRFFFDYQLNHMYWRYFMWNFAGRQNDKQGHVHNRNFDGNWISGVSVIDRIRLGPQEEMPKNMLENKGRNKFYFIPFVLGLLGISLLYKKDRRQLIVTGVLFLFAGVLIIVFLNQPPYEPRERDYVHVGSFMVFAIWAGLGLLKLNDWLLKKVKSGIALTLAIVMSLSAPVLMARQGWDDHDRSERFLGLDLAKNILDSCPPNAIYFANADNDTYPLWYLQNVERYRLDVRIINQNLLPTDWYSQQMMKKVYESDPLPLTFNNEQVKAGVNEYFQYVGGPSGTQPIELSTFIQSIIKSGIETYENTNYMVKVDKDKASKMPGLSDEDKQQICDTMQFSFGARNLHKGDLILLDLIATNAAQGWKRPICFSTIAGNEGYKGLENYIERRGMVFQLIPVNVSKYKTGIDRINREVTYGLLMEKFGFGGMNKKTNFYLDDKAEVIPSSGEKLFIELAAQFIMDAEQIKFYDSTLSQPGNENKYKALLLKAGKLMDRCATEIPEKVWHPEPNVRLMKADNYRKLNRIKDAENQLTILLNESEANLKYYLKFGNREDLVYFIASNCQNALYSIYGVEESAGTWGLSSVKQKAEQLKKKYEADAKAFLR
ncbi:MAG TPA: DUF2723 domain-containing protein [Bacteroidia bacterium]